MLAERDRELLTAYVDGELSSRQRKYVLRLLQRSPEARVLLRQMQQDAAELRCLPRPRLDADFPRRVLQAIAEHGLRPGRSRLPTATRPTLSLWAGLAAAAAVLLAVAAGSYFYFAGPDRPTSLLVQQPKTPPSPDAPNQASNSSPSRSQPPSGPLDQPSPAEEIAAPLAWEVLPAPAELPPLDERPIRAPVASPGNILERTGPLPSLEVFRKVENPKLALTARPRDIDDEKLTELRKRLEKDGAFRIELLTPDSSKAFERLQAAFKAQGTKLVVEQIAEFRLKYPRLKTNLVLYVEDVLPDELVRMVQRLANQERKATTDLFSLLAVTELTKDDRSELAKLMNVAVKYLQLPKPAAPRPEAGKPPAKPKDHQGLVMPYNPNGPYWNSPEIYRYLTSRKPVRPGSLQVVLVLREMDQ